MTFLSWLVIGKKVKAVCTRSTENMNFPQLLYSTLVTHFCSCAHTNPTYSKLVKWKLINFHTLSQLKKENKPKPPNQTNLYCLLYLNIATTIDKWLWWYFYWNKFPSRSYRKICFIYSRGEVKRLEKSLLSWIEKIWLFLSLNNQGNKFL